MSGGATKGKSRLVVLSSRTCFNGCFMPIAWAAEDAFAAVTGAKIVTDWLPGFKAKRLLARVFSRLHASPLGATAVLSNKSLRGRDCVLFLMGLSKEVLPILQDSSCRKWLYLFDTWEPDWLLAEKTLRNTKSLQGVFLASSQAAEHFKARLGCGVHWVPQAASSAEFSHRAQDWDAKRKIILNIGRTNGVLNDFFIAFSRKHGFDYLRDEFPGQMMFKTREEFLSVLYQSQIVVVHPRNLEYPELTGNVSMLTARNFEAYQSAGVVCGFKPDSGEFERVLSGFPFVEYGDPRQFECDLLIALQDRKRWVAAAERCRAEHSWQHRMKLLEQIIWRLGAD